MRTGTTPYEPLRYGRLFGSCCFNCMHWVGYKKNMRAYCKRLNISGYDAPHGTSGCVLWEKRENARLPNDARRATPLDGGSNVCSPLFFL